jgi:hypothetical protein
MPWPEIRKSITSFQKGKASDRFFKKSSAKNFCFPRLLSGHSVAAQRPRDSKVFWLLFF